MRPWYLCQQVWSVWSYASRAAATEYTYLAVVTLSTLPIAENQGSNQGHFPHDRDKVD